MTRRAPPICKRRGCENHRSSWQFACESCWGEVPYSEKQRYLKVARAKLTGLKAKVSREILRALGRKAPTEGKAQDAYARTCLRLGERAEAGGEE